VDDYNEPAAPVWPGVPARRQRRLRPLGCLALLVIVVVVGAAAVWLPNPWVFHIGGRFTADRSWHGVGTITATNGGRYVLYVGFQAELMHESHAGAPYHCGLPTCDTIEGEGKLCTLSGVAYPLTVRGQVHAWWATDRAGTGMQLFVPDHENSTVVGAFTGQWRGPQLDLTDTSEFTLALTKEGAIRTVRSTTDDGTARTTLRYGTEDDFSRACRALATS
jgi:hypothetical protein